MSDNDKSYVYADNNFSDKIMGFHVESVKKVPKARVIGAPIETGQVSFDNKVIDPYDLIVKGTIVKGEQYSSKWTVEKLENMLENKDFEFYSVKDGENGYSYLTLVQFPHERNVEKYDWIQCELVFSHVMLVQTDGLGKKSSNSENSDFRNLGYSGGVAS